jgi:Asp-tRNA(Asn)/Glu-tRNA(Gln) amidotransferase A subunit family amidase
MARQIREKKISPAELAEAHLAKIERLNPKLNAFVHVDPERVRRDARQAEAAVSGGQALGPLHGVPISIKSSVDVAGMKCEAGTRLRAGHVATEDAPLVERLRKAGAIILGVTTCSTDERTVRGTSNARRADPAGAKRLRLLRECQQEAWAAMAEDPFACRRTSAASAD